MMTNRAIANLRVLLVDDHPVFREGLAAILADHQIDVVGQAADAARAFVLAEALRPEVFVVDLSLPNESGIDIARELGKRLPRSKILILTMHRVHDYIEEALAAGVVGYASKSQPSSEIVEAIWKVSRGELYLPTGRPAAADVVLEEAPGDGLRLLSKREREIFDLVVRGLSNEEVGIRLCISIKTVETHRTRINRKLEVHSTAALVRLAARRGLLST